MPTQMATTTRPGSRVRAPEQRDPGGLGVRPRFERSRGLSRWLSAGSRSTRLGEPVAGSRQPSRAGKATTYLRLPFWAFLRVSEPDQP